MGIWEGLEKRKGRGKGYNYNLKKIIEIILKYYNVAEFY